MIGKVDNNSKIIPNTTIEIYNETDELLFTKKTDENGMVTIENLPIGKYYVLEKETASEDYVLNTEKIYFEISENESVAKIEMINEIVIKVPNTEKNELPFFRIVRKWLLWIIKITYQEPVTE